MEHKFANVITMLINLIKKGDFLNFSQLIEIQKKFDFQHRGKFNWDQKIVDTNIQALGYILLCLHGEFGETTNLVNNVMRGDYHLVDILPELGDEIADVFISF
jgi:NTP pyrophosphatase (non-canonical NTP hydrolase)